MTEQQKKIIELETAINAAGPDKIAKQRELAEISSNLSPRYLELMRAKRRDGLTHENALEAAKQQFESDQAMSTGDVKYFNGAVDLEA